MQRCFQPNTLIGNLVAVGIVAALTVWLKGQDTETVSIRQDRSIAREFVQPADSRQSGRGHDVETGAFNGGWIDRNKIHILPDRPMSVATLVTPATYAFHADLTPANDNVFEGIDDESEKKISPGDGDFGLPGYPAPVVAGSNPWPFSGSKPQIRKVKADRPLTISHWSAPLYPWKARNVEGRTTVRIVVDDHGALRQMRVLNETPAKLGFGQALKDALNQCWYDAAIIRGQETAMEVTVTYEFSLRLHAKPMVTTSGYVSIVIP